MKIGRFHIYETWAVDKKMYSIIFNIPDLKSNILLILSTKKKKPY